MGGVGNVARVRDRGGRQLVQLQRPARRPQLRQLPRAGKARGPRCAALVLAGHGAVALIVPFIEPSEMLHSSPLSGWSGRYFHSENMTIGHWDIAEGAADLHEHHHEQEEVWNVVEGEILLVVDDQECRLGRGGAAVIPANARHSARVLGACRVVTVDYPVRHELPGVRST